MITYTISKRGQKMYKYLSMQLFLGIWHYVHVIKLSCDIFHFRVQTIWSRAVLGGPVHAASDWLNKLTLLPWKQYKLCDYSIHIHIESSSLHSHYVIVNKVQSAIWSVNKMYKVLFRYFHFLVYFFKNWTFVSQSEFLSWV
jgi:hypothetical protein